jgi:uncharacterized protein (DUF433 family)
MPALLASVDGTGELLAPFIACLHGDIAAKHGPACACAGSLLVVSKPLVSRDPEIMSGALCFMGTRVPVKNLFDYLEGSSSLAEFLEDFPTVSRERAVAVLEAAREHSAADAPAA